MPMDPMMGGGMDPNMAPPPPEGMPPEQSGMMDAQGGPPPQQGDEAVVEAIQMEISQMPRPQLEELALGMIMELQGETPAPDAGPPQGGAGVM